jgi:hypothetical protein
MSSASMAAGSVRRQLPAGCRHDRPAGPAAKGLLLRAVPGQRGPGRGGAGLGPAHRRHQRRYAGRRPPQRLRLEPVRSVPRRRRRRRLVPLHLQALGTQEERPETQAKPPTAAAALRRPRFRGTPGAPRLRRDTGRAWVGPRKILWCRLAQARGSDMKFSAERRKSGCKGACLVQVTSTRDALLLAGLEEMT